MTNTTRIQLGTDIDPYHCHIGFRMPPDAGMGCLALRGKNLARRLPVLVACLVLFGAIDSLVASEGETEYRFMPYLWTAGLDVETGPPGRTTSAEVSFQDYVEMIDPSAAFAFEAIGETWSLLGDVMYVNLSEKASLPAGTLDYENTQLILELAVGYKPEGWKDTRILVGARYLDMDTTIELSAGPKVDVGQNWADPFVGLEWRRLITSTIASRWKSVTDIWISTSQTANLSLTDTWKGYRLV